jgi:streptogramin lyase
LTPQAAAPGFEKVGPVAKNLWPFTALNVYYPKLKTDVFYITSFNSSGFGQLIRLDYRHARAKSWTLPAGIGSWGLIQGKDGNLYLGSYNEGKLLCFDPRTESWIPLPQMSEAFRKAESIICALVQAPDGDIYYGTYPGAHLVRYDPHRQTVEDLGQAADENYLRHLAVTPDGIILCAVGTRHSRIIAYDPKTHQFSELPSQGSQNSGVMLKPLVSTQYVAQPGPDSATVYDAHTLRVLHVFQLHDASSFQFLDAAHLFYQEGTNFQTLDLATGATKHYCTMNANVLQNGWYITPSGNLMGLRVQSYYYVDVKSRQTERHSIPIEGLGQDVLWLRSAPDGTIYGGPELGQTLFRYAPSKHQLKSYDQVIDLGGEIYYGIPYRKRFYTISYIEATLAVYDPSHRWRLGSAPDANPRTILHIPEQQYRPLGGIHLGPGEKMYIGTQPDYGLLGGALSVFDPASEKLDVYRNLFPAEEIGAVTADERYVYGEADKGGGGGSRPSATGTHFFVWDPAQRKIVFDHVFMDGHAITAIAAVRGHAYFALGDQMWDYDRDAGTLKVLATLGGHDSVPLESLQAAADGTLWMIAGHELARVDPATREVMFFPETADKATSGLTIGPDGAVYFGSHTDVWIYHPKRPSPPASFGQ